MSNIWQYISIFGNFEFGVSIVFLSLLMYFLSSKKSQQGIRWFVFGVLPASILAYIVTSMLKLAFKVPRMCIGLDGCPQSYSFPSDHASIAFAVAVALMMYKKDLRFSVVFMTFAILVAVSRLMLGVHTVIDVVGGAVVGSIVGWLVYRNHEKIYKLFSWLG
ncbi:phosphatase PAP2 family protein [archaeon]|nr:MAG: phosphatase PAP2 family protein [archaeon]